MKNTVIFDMDGTLLDTLEDLRDSVNFALEKYKYPKRTIEEIRNFVGNGVKVLVDKALPGGTENEDFGCRLQFFLSISLHRQSEYCH